MFKISVDTRQIVKLSNLYKAVGAKAPLVMIRAVNHTGAKARTAMIRALVDQTGMKRKTMATALKAKKAFNGSSFTIKAKGGNVRLMFFKPRESRKGVTAAPWNKRTVYPGTFMKGGRFPKRVPLKTKGAVLQRAGKARLPLAAAPRSGLYIPEEMVKGASQGAFYATVERELPGRIAHELYRILG